MRVLQCSQDYRREARLFTRAGRRMVAEVANLTIIPHALKLRVFGMSLKYENLMSAEKKYETCLSCD